MFYEAKASFGGWPSLERPENMKVTSVERLYGLMVAKFRVDSLFKATVQPDDKNSEKHVLLVSFYVNENLSNFLFRSINQL